MMLCKQLHSLFKLYFDLNYVVLFLVIIYDNNVKLQEDGKYLKVLPIRCSRIIERLL